MAHIMHSFGCNSLATTVKVFGITRFSHHSNSLRIQDRANRLGCTLWPHRKLTLVFRILFGDQDNLEVFIVVHARASVSTFILPSAPTVKFDFFETFFQQDISFGGFYLFFRLRTYFLL